MKPEAPCLLHDFAIFSSKRADVAAGLFDGMGRLIRSYGASRNFCGLIIAAKIRTIRILDNRCGKWRFPAHFVVPLDVAPIMATMKIGRRPSRNDGTRRNRIFSPGGWE
ncbi:hypothetical protein CupriaWKF_01295 [Cupriavidus sp. WKF15]|uniref:hypothetical protein n=1 Tax=Cupriavidus sp. WKF15 TaxID=3032282 RepID=UPI0023E28DB7|nr:hypothetical protein [Cupriavidus sp. WKF15]WER46255.1 hypothetical protein CupriaWKF_01295 [Cupriavidus sp. WKF15]